MKTFHQFLEDIQKRKDYEKERLRRKKTVGEFDPIVMKLSRLFNQEQY
jgi:hypothetical protein